MKLIVITGPTASGKSAMAVKLAQHCGCDIISADSRQIYKGIPIVTATPTPEEMGGVKHHFISCLDLDQYFSAADFERMAIDVVKERSAVSDVIVMVGGSMLYVDAVTRGIDDLPTISPAVRKAAAEIYERRGLQGLRLELLEYDPIYYREVDLNNHKRLIHAIEICMEAGKPYSSLRTGNVRRRPFDISIFAIDRPREELFDRINRRVDAMVEAGLEQEARRVYDMRHLNSLNTVGLKEMFAYFDGEMDRATAIERIKKNTRVYAKKQLTWMKRRPDIRLISPDTDPTTLI
ncbi:MAG: tRNA (adenosine(37)-N6)-dimethylallyltransferase MiaA [Muribaculaceae bacterium]|nr:tRNA (adenosine(37)-N6)-dimethylallyltransferase MiaA [Muribaculaceae bacterium]